MINTLSDKELIVQVVKKVKEEKLIASEVLSYLEEIDRRKVFIDHGVPSLYKFCTRILKYSDCEAAVRVKVVRAFKASPIIKEKIQDGSLSLTTAASLYSFFKNNKQQNKDDVVKKVCGKSSRQAKDILNFLADNPLPRSLNITLPEHLLRKLENISDDFEGCTELEIIESLIDRHIEQNKKAKDKRRSTKHSKNQRYITRVVKEHVDKRAQNRCEGISPISGKRCQSRTNLQYDHLRPISKGGDSSKENIRKLCFGCNARAAVKVLGVQKMLQGDSVTLPKSVNYYLEQTSAGPQYSFIAPGG
ncbi:MAG: HNH endonuclease [Bacteriovoracaceae bacterium]|nr:HNH endonuclease [Bacteriovoracaceae bacterium]